MRVGIIGIYHESNTFISMPTTLDLFRQSALLAGDAIRQEYDGVHHEVGGFFQGLDEAEIESVPILLAAATPSGPVTAEALDAILEMVWQGLDTAGKLDGLLLAPHGAAVAENHDDMDGYWLSLVRERMGTGFPIVSTIDPHANLSPQMIAACDATVAYRSNPHLDQRQVGLEATQLLIGRLRGDINPTQAAAFPPVAINIERQLTTQPPCLPMYELADELLERSGILSNSIVLGFPFADVPEMGSSFIAVTDGDALLAEQTVRKMSDFLVENRQKFVAELVTIDEAIDDAVRSEGPVCLLDIGDNVGGGSAADGTWLAHAVHQRGGPQTLVCINDSAAVTQAREVGVGNRRHMTIGGKVDDLHGPPLESEVTVLSLHDGHFTEAEPRHGGKASYDMGPTVVVKTDTQLTIVLTSHRTPPFSLGQVTSCGLDPAAFHILIAKGVHAPVAAYTPVSKRLIRVNTPGSTSADLSQFEFHRRRRPLFPFEEIR